MPTPRPDTYRFIRYLAAKQSVDDRALNRNVWNSLGAALPSATLEAPLRVLELGAGVGTMAERMVARRMLSHAVYTALDAQPDNIDEAARLLPLWARSRGLSVAVPSSGLSPVRRARLAGDGVDLVVEHEAVDVFDFADREAGRRQWDLLIAHAFLDLVDIPFALPRFFRLLKSGGLFYFTINFDGATLLEPAIDPAFDDEIERLYHRTMDERVTGGRPSGDSRAGRRLFTHLRDAGAVILDAGSSDWVVFATDGEYPVDEAYFLHFIVDTLRGALERHPALAGREARFGDWIERRHRQIEDGQLVYIAHQLDFVGRWPGAQGGQS